MSIQREEIVNEGRVGAGNIPFLELGDDYTDVLFVIVN